MILVARRIIFPSLVFLLSGCFSQERVISFGGATMGTTYSVKISSKEKVSVEPLKAEVDALLVEVNRQMSTYISSSEISKLNQSPKKQKVKISSYFNQVLKYSLQLAEKTGGIFDPTIGPLVNLWGFGPRGKRKVPSEEQIKEVMKYVGYEKVKLATEKKRSGWNMTVSHFVQKSHDQVYVDLSSTAKGFGVDVISEYLMKKKLQNHLVEIGGEMKARGLKREKPWRIAIESPDEDSRSIQKVLQLKDLSIATSGNYRNFFKENGQKFSHTIDVVSGRPVKHRMASVSVLSSSCMESDGLATAFMAMGPKKAWDFANKWKVPAYFILVKESKEDEEEGFEIKKTSFFDQLF